jgi:hypothetical protein
MPSKPIEILPENAPLDPALDLMHVAQWNGSGYDSRRATVGEIAAALASSLLGIETVTDATYTIAAADNYKQKRFTNAAGCTVTVPLQASVPISIGTRVRMTAAASDGSGDVVLVPEGAVILNSRDDALTSNGHMAVFEIVKVAEDEWDVLGDVI